MGSLILGGFTASDVGVIIDWAERAASSAKRKAMVSTVLEDHARMREVLDDIAMVQRIRNAQAPGSPAKVQDLDEIDIARRIQILVDVDHRPIPEAAAVFNLTAGVAQELLAKGRLIRESMRPELAPRPAKSDHDHNAQVERFKKAMVVSRKRGIPISQALEEGGR